MRFRATYTKTPYAILWRGLIAGLGLRGKGRMRSEEEEEEEEAEERQACFSCIGGSYHYQTGRMFN